MRENLKILFCILFVFCFSSCNQDGIREKINRLEEVKEIPYICEGGKKCGDDLFWNVLRLKEKAIAILIEKLNDTTITKAGVPLFGGKHTVADISYVALEEIIH